MNGVARAPARKDLNEAFPLRGFVTCGHCEKPMTACWSRGRSSSYPYYLCVTKGCESRGKSVRREKLEAEFEALLLELRPSEGLFNLAREMFEELWNSRLAGSKSQGASMQAELGRIERKAEQIMDRIVETESATVIAAYENRLRKLEEQKVELREKVAACGRPLQSFDETFRTAMKFLSEPQRLWHSERIEDKRAVLKLAFAEKLPYMRGEGFRTASLALPFSVLTGLERGKSKMARPAGLEPATTRLEGGCSVQLSYGRLSRAVNASSGRRGRSGNCRSSSSV
jgi:site-specific DNA recombinase